MTATMSTPSASAAATARRGVIWIVDDSKLEIDRATRVLSAAHDVMSFTEGASMLERLSAGAPDVVLLDWQMPGLSGLDLCHFLREQYDEVTLPILMLTGRGAREDFAEGLAAGANDYVAKPYDDTELRARVRTLVRIRRQADETRERELWLRTTLSSIGEGVIATDARGKVLFMNPVAELLTGVSQADAFQKPLADVCRVVEDVNARATFILRRDGTSIAVERTASPLRAEGSTQAALGTVYVLRDVTERTKHETEARARADFEEKLIGIVSHDLRNPLQAILLSTTAMLSNEDIDARTTKSVLRIQRSVDRATRLVSDVLDFTQARLGTGIPVNRQTVAVDTLAAQVVEEVLAGHPRREIVVEHSGAGEGFWDPERIAQVLANLLGNALKYGAPGRPVTLRTRGEEDVLVVEVHNDGDPIAADVVLHMFEAMKRGVDANDGTGRSVGLGLYIVKHIIDAHGGEISVASTAGAGTTFSIRLPRA